MYVEVDLDDKPRKLRYRYNDVADVEEKAGLGIGAMFSEDRTGFHSIRLLIWGGLKWADRGLTVHRAGDLIQTYLDRGGELNKLMEKVRQALERGGIMKFVAADSEEGEEGNAEAETG